MCFSATASFTVAIATTFIGVAAVKQVTHPREILLAATPFLFAVQQIVEGILWLELTGTGDSEVIAPLSFIFQIFAKVLWPAYAALAIYLIEPDRRRQQLLLAIAVIGILLSINLLLDLHSNPPNAVVLGHSIDYSSEDTILSWQMFPYFLCTCGALFLSSHKLIRIFAGIIFVGFLVSAYLYLATFTSVWCFFAASSSSLIYFYFRRNAVLVHPHIL